jgi:hypothetical protein
VSARPHRGATVRRYGTALAAARRVIGRDGLRVTTGRLLERAAAPMVAGRRPFAAEVRPEHLVPPPAPPVPYRALQPDDRLVLHWVTNPPDERSGGITTLMRAVAMLEARGHECRISILYLGEHRPLDRHREVLRERFPAVRAVAEDLRASGLRPADAVVATGWPTAYAVRAVQRVGVPFYFVQDFEPWFYPVGSNATLAEQTYRLGFHGVTAGPWLADLLPREYGMPCDAFDLGVDLDDYRLDPDRSGETARDGPARDGPARDGIVFYARPDTARRGFELGMLALEQFSARHPEITIHLVGQRVGRGRAPFPFVDHGHLDARDLAAVYRRCHAGLVLSLTNLSLLPAELLATGCIPVMNDADHTRASFDNPFAVFSGARPDQLADALSRVVEHPLDGASRAVAAASVAGRSWDLVADQIEAAFRSGVRARFDRAALRTPTT